MGSTEDDVVTERWLDEGGHVKGHARDELIAEIARADEHELVALWKTVQREWGDEASRLWQEALSASDASET